MKQIKVPTTIMDVYHEMAACRQLAKENDTGWRPSLKAILYTAKGEKLYRLADRAMQAAFPEIKILADWELDLASGMFTLVRGPVEVEAAPKKLRKAKIAPAPTLPT